MSEQSEWSIAELHDALGRYESELRAAGLKRNTITTYVQHPERFLAWLEGGYRPRVRSEESSTNGGRTKYQALTRYLRAQRDLRTTMRFAEIEAVLGFDLPASARRHRAWWANERVGSHSHAAAWMGADRRTEEVDLRSEVVTFAADGSPAGPHGFIGSVHSDDVRGRDADELLQREGFGQR